MTFLEIMAIVLIVWILLGIINFVIFALTTRWDRDNWSNGDVLVFTIIPIVGFALLVVFFIKDIIIKNINRKKKVEIQE